MKRGDLVKRKSAYRHSLGGAMNSQVVSEYVGVKWGIILRVHDNEKIDICPYCAKGITRVGINACMHCKQPLIWYMDVVGKPGDEKICREEYKAKLQVKHPGLANQGWTNINNPWLIASAISLLLAFIFSILLFNQ